MSNGEPFAYAGYFEALPGIVRATALELLNTRASQEQAGKAEPLLEDDDPLIRAAAVALQMRAPSNERTQRIVAALDDPVKSVRITAARKLLGLPIAHLPKKMALSAQRASGEWQAALGARADFPETHMVIGGSALILRNPRAAMAAFQEVTRMDPQLVEAWGLIVRLHAANGDWGAARSAVQRAQTVNPNNPYIDDLIRWLQQQSPSD